ncbi:Putative oxidoreductase GLYR1 like protein [Dufourea novaeangliae]|uniref:Putative oxidoreductase GLYR1 like protein n=1 Tax=Dufourea novaeangliae TaxID=178035 RepID=A0A154NXI6_DUFNO|nr:Putative oxidoreductase GLYR1 like protein [Dufourea novaeangliae]
MNTKKGPVQCIFFFGTNNYAWIEESNIKPYLKYKDTLVKSSKSGAFKDAVEAIEEFIANGEVFEDGLDPDSLFDRLKEGSLSKEKTVVKTPKPRKETPKTKRLDTGGSDARRPAKKQRRESSTSNSNRVGSLSPALNHSTPLRKSGSTLLNRPANIARPVTPPLDVETLSQTLKEKNILPSTLKFGFLGLGIMGSGIVKNLINSGHSVIVWNRTQEKGCGGYIPEITGRDRSEKLGKSKYRLKLFVAKITEPTFQLVDTDNQLNSQLHCDLPLLAGSTPICRSTNKKRKGLVVS